MKKIIALILVAVMLTALAACGKKPDDTDSSETSTTTEKVETGSSSETVTPPEKKELSDIIDATYEKHPISIEVFTDVIDSSDTDTVQFMAGITSMERVSEICVSAPMMAPPAYQMTVVRVKDASDAEAVAREMLENADPAKWIRVQAERVRIGVCGDTIMMVMSSVEEADALISAFGEVCGGLTLTLEK